MLWEWPSHQQVVPAAGLSNGGQADATATTIVTSTEGLTHAILAQF
jgi:hypothetical protein